MPADPLAPETEPDDFVPDKAGESTAAGAWKTWKAAPSPATMSAALKTVRPIIDRAVGGVRHASKELMSAEAKRLAIGAIKTYDPAQGTALSTHVYSHLRPMRGFAEKSTSVIDRTRTDNTLARRYLEARSTLNQTLNRDPSDDELTDHLNITPKELVKMRRVAVGETGEEDYSTHASADPGDASVGLWADYVYSDLNPINKKIFEMKTGRNGQPMLSTDEVAAKLGLSSVHVNNQAGKIAQRILDGANALNVKKMHIDSIEEAQ